jgi:hypothetical protein
MELEYQKIINLISEEYEIFKNLEYRHNIVKGSIPILWFGDYEAYFRSNKKIITVSLNPSDIEFKNKKTEIADSSLRFPDFNGSVKSLYLAYNNYFKKNPYSSWFKASFETVLKSFSASFFEREENRVLHTDIGSIYATSPTWTGLTNIEKSKLEELGSKSWHKLIQLLEPDVILFSASRGFENKIKFGKIDSWKPIDVKAKSPLLRSVINVSKEKETVVLFQVQGRKPFLQTSKEEKSNFNKYISLT